MAVRPPPSPVTMTVRTPTMRTEYKGNLSGAFDQLLCASGDTTARLAAIEKLKATHERLCKWEAENEAKDG